jgi:hypothetical protein
MKARFFFAMLLSTFCGVPSAQTTGDNTSARQLSAWLKGDDAGRKAFQRYVLSTYATLRESREICPPQGRTLQADDLAAIEAAKTGVEEGLFDEDGSAVNALKETLGFWFPCPM